MPECEECVTDASETHFQTQSMSLQFLNPETGVSFVPTQFQESETGVDLPLQFQESETTLVEL